MTLVDTSIWIDHLRRPDGGLVKRLNDGMVLTHPFVIGELALGTLKRHDEVMELLRALPGVPVLSDQTVLAFVTRHHLQGTGIGWGDAHLLAAADAAGVVLLTRDARLRAQAVRLHIAAN